MKKGMSLIETMVAMLILLIGLMGTASILTMKIQDLVNARRFSKGMVITQKRMEILHARQKPGFYRWDNPINDSDTFQYNREGELDVNGNNSFTVTFGVADPETTTMLPMGAKIISSAMDDNEVNDNRYLIQFPVGRYWLQ